MSPVECGVCRAAVLVADDSHWEGGEVIERIPHQPWCRYVAPVRPFVKAET